MKMLKGAKALPPLVDVEKPGNPHYWISPAIPWLPAREIDGDNFIGIMLTACILRGPKGKKIVELRLIRQHMMLKRSGVSIPDGVEQVVAWGVMPLETFLYVADMKSSLTAVRYTFSFWEKKVNVTSALVPGMSHDRSHIVVNVFRGKDKAVSGFDMESDSSITFRFHEGAKSFKKWRDACAKES